MAKSQNKFGIGRAIVKNAKEAEGEYKGDVVSDILP